MVLVQNKVNKCFKHAKLTVGMKTCCLTAWNAAE